MSERKRIFLFILMFVLVAILPWWLSGIFIIMLSVYIPFYPEMIFFGFLIDILFYDKKALFTPALTISLLVYVIINLVRTRIRT